MEPFVIIFALSKMQPVATMQVVVEKYQVRNIIVCATRDTARDLTIYKLTLGARNRQIQALFIFNGIFNSYAYKLDSNVYGEPTFRPSFFTFEV